MDHLFFRPVCRRDLNPNIPVVSLVSDNELVRRKTLSCFDVWQLRNPRDLPSSCFCPLRPFWCLRRYPGSTGLQGASFEPSYVRYEHAHEPAVYRSGGGFSNVQGLGGMITLPQSRTMHAMERAPVMVRPYSAAPLLPGSARMPILRPQSAVPIDYAYHRGKALELYGGKL